MTELEKIIRDEILNAARGCFAMIGIALWNFIQKAKGKMTVIPDQGL